MRNFNLIVDVIRKFRRDNDGRSPDRVHIVCPVIEADIHYDFIEHVQITRDVNQRKRKKRS